MTFRGFRARRCSGAVTAGCLLGAMAAATIAAPAANADPDCSSSGLAGTVTSVTGTARQYLDNHPDANQVLNAASNEPRPQAEADVRAYFADHLQEYYELRGILAPIGDAQRQCNVTLLPPDLASAYDQFMAG